MTPEELNKLEDDKDEINTKKTTTWAVKHLETSWLTKTWTSTLKATLPLLEMTFYDCLMRLSGRPRKGENTVLPV